MPCWFESSPGHISVEYTDLYYLIYRIKYQYVIPATNLPFDVIVFYFKLA
ncbi:MAG: hypothetical protein V3U16_06190 [Candidatus Neomarinimicrobiota bacterium]